MLNLIASKRAIKMLIPEMRADKVMSICKLNNVIKSTEPSQDTVAYSELWNTTGCSLHKMSREMPPIAPVITPIKLATNQGAPTMRDTNVPAMLNVANPAASGMRKKRGDIVKNLAVKNMMMALAIEAIKNI